MRNSLPAGRNDNERAQFRETRVRQVESAVLGEHTVATALRDWNLRHDGKTTVIVRSGNSKFGSFRSSNIQQVRGRRIVNVIHAIACIDHRKNGAVVPSVEYFCERATGDEQLTGLRVHRQAVRTFLAARRIPVSDRLASL